MSWRALRIASSCEVLAKQLPSITAGHLARWWGKEHLYDPRKHFFYFCTQGEEEETSNNKELTCKWVYDMASRVLWETLGSAYCIYTGQSRHRFWADVFHVMKTTPSWWDSDIHFRIWSAVKARKLKVDHGPQGDIIVGVPG